MSQQSSTCGNRKERRARASAGKQQDGQAIPLAQPSRSQPAGKTLLELAEERNLLPPSLSPPSVSAKAVRSDGTIESLSNDEAHPGRDYIDIILYTASLSLLRLTLTILIENQYGSEPPTLASLPHKVYETIIAAPHSYVLLVLVALLHPQASLPSFQALFAVMSLACGAWLVHTTNRDAYLATMAKAPSLGTLWVWSVVELRWEVAMATVAAVAAWAAAMGYGFR